ncbi:MAG: segregation/condensation protein A [Cytophagales bacterium]|nr:segregation/condensation protein A [Cytophagales bacterium]MDW8384584.1 segregation/condensation protein A [Flammeovirgaceae bacterium]
MHSTYQIKIPIFEGPFDLLLFFIKRDEINIYDIPIAKITDDFLSYLKELKKLNIEIAGEFILMASTLMSIKAKMLLPRFQKDEEEHEIDPRTELVKHLLEYKRFKDVAIFLETLENQMISRYTRQNISKELSAIASIFQIDIELQNVDLYQLLLAYQRAIEKQKNNFRPVHQIVPFPYTVEVQKQWILNWLSERKRLFFYEIIQHNPNKIAVIFNFLAILELAQLQKIQLFVGESFNHFEIALA